MRVIKNKMTSAEELREFYEEKYPRGQEITDIPEDDDFMYGQVLSQIRPYMRPDLKVLDLGCNNGNLSFYMARAGCDVLGIDLARNAISIARQSAAHYGITHVKLERLDFLQEWQTPKVFDFVLCSHVIEHVPQDQLFLQKIASCIKENGHLLLLTPTRYSSMYLSHKLLTGRFSFDEEVGHLRRYDVESMTAIVEAAGFQIERLLFLDGVLREWFILFPPLRKLNRIWSRRYIRSLFNKTDSLLARWFVFPASICVHAKRC